MSAVGVVRILSQPGVTPEVVDAAIGEAGDDGRGGIGPGGLVKSLTDADAVKIYAERAEAKLAAAEDAKAAEARKQGDRLAAIRAGGWADKAAWRAEYNQVPKGGQVRVMLGDWKLAHPGATCPTEWWYDRPIVVWLGKRYKSWLGATEANEKERQRLNAGRAEKAKLDAEFEEKQKAKTKRRAPRLPATATPEPAGKTEKSDGRADGERATDGPTDAT